MQPNDGRFEYDNRPEYLLEEEYMEAFEERDFASTGDIPAEGFSCGHEPLNEYGHGRYPYESYWIDNFGFYCREIVELSDSF